MESRNFDALARVVALKAPSRRRLLAAAVAGILGVAGAVEVIDGVDARPRCPGNKKKCGGGCCPARAPKCCKNYCCKQGTSCCGNKKCCR